MIESEYTMVFSNPIFLFFFLPCVLLCDRLSPKRIRNAVLLFFSLIFYAWGEPVYVLLMLAVILLNYTAGILMGRFSGSEDGKKRKAVLIAAVVSDLSILFYFKYTNFFLGILSDVAGVKIPFREVVLPIGISFYIFQSMSYVIDVYRRNADVQHNVISFGTYVSLFPQLIAGPIVFYRDIARQLARREESLDKFSDGVRDFILGLSKKVLLANQMGLLADRLLLSEAGTLSAWAGIAAYSMQIYFDFSGYSDMAIGLGKMLGFRFAMNFNYPYVSKSITEFWRRWHISLSSWFREYVYIPLGGNRKGLPRQCLNLLIVWSLTGLWHGASLNFVLWGLYYALVLILEKLFLGKLLTRLPGILRRVYTLFIVAFGWGIFYFTDLGQWLGFVHRLFSSLPDARSGLTWILAYLPIGLAAAVASTQAMGRLLEKLRRSRAAWAEIPLLAVLLLLCTAALVSQSYNPFIYFRF